MLNVPVAKNDCVREFLDATRSVSSFSISEDRPECMEITFSLDYHNFAILAVGLGQRFRKAGHPGAIGEGIDLFSQTLRENVLHIAIRDFFAQMREEKMNGPLAEVYEACEAHIITPDDLMKGSFRNAVERIRFHGGNDAVRIFDDKMRVIASGCEIGVFVTIGDSLWDMHFDYQNIRSQFFRAPSTPMLFRKILTPAMRVFYDSFQI